MENQVIRCKRSKSFVNLNLQNLQIVNYNLHASVVNIFMYTLEKRKMIYIMSRKPTWYHTHCITPNNKLPLWYDPTWVIGDCNLCAMSIMNQDWWNGCSYNTSQKKFYDEIDRELRLWK